MRHLLVVALLSCACTPEKKASVAGTTPITGGGMTAVVTGAAPTSRYLDLVVDNSTPVNTSVWTRPKPCPVADECTVFEARDNGVPVFIIRDGDGPSGKGGPCDLGALVRAAKADIENHARFVPMARRSEMEDYKAQVARCEPPSAK